MPTQVQTSRTFVLCKIPASCKGAVAAGSSLPHFLCPSVHLAVVDFPCTSSSSLRRQLRQEAPGQVAAFLLCKGLSPARARGRQSPGLGTPGRVAGALTPDRELFCSPLRNPSLPGLRTRAERSTMDRWSDPVCFTASAPLKHLDLFSSLARVQCLFFFLISLVTSLW